MAGGTPAMGALRGRRGAWRLGDFGTASAQTGHGLTAPFMAVSKCWRARLGGVGAVLLLAGCAALTDAPRLAYRCPADLSFEARLYEDMAVLEGLRGHAVLERLPDAEDGALRYADVTVHAQFGLGVDGRLVRLDYTSIPEPVYCERAAADGAAVPVRAHARPGPRPPPPFDPDAPVQTNIRTGDGNNGPG